MPGFSEATRQKLGTFFLSLVRGEGAPLADFTRGDAGLFGPQSVAWKVHADYPSMLVGGVSALLLQAMHPLAMAGVYEHSNFRKDPFRRLRRTASFIAGTTYGDTHSALGLIEMVRRVHRSVVGTAPDGRPYAAGDPALLTWIHTAEMYSFLRAYQRYSGESLSIEEQDQYFAETAQIAERLGAVGVPHSLAQTEDYFQALLPELTWGEQAREAIEFLQKTKAPHWVFDGGFLLIFEAAVDLLPVWAQRIRKPPSSAGAASRLSSALNTWVLRPTLRAGGSLLRWATHDQGIVTQARARTAKEAAPQKP